MLSASTAITLRPNLLKTASELNFSPHDAEL